MVFHPLRQEKLRKIETLVCFGVWRGIFMRNARSFYAVTKVMTLARDCASIPALELFNPLFKRLFV